MTQPLAADLPLPRLREALQTDGTGLSAAEAATRLARDGANEIAERRESIWRKFLGYFWGPIPWMIEAALALSAVGQSWADFVIILVLLLANGLVGFFEEHQAGNAIAALKSRLAATARVKRGGTWAQIPARELVPGDLVHLRLGDIVPADLRIVAGSEAELDQSALTGESLPAHQPVGGVAYSGSIIRTGEFDGLVYATGPRTFFGHTAQLVQEGGGKSHFQQAIGQIGNALIVLALVLVALLLVVTLTRGDPLLETVQFALVLAVAAIPVALPTVLSVTMAVGARRLAARQAIVSRLAAIEELAGVDVLCSDKTGTLTMNQLTLGDPAVFGTATPQEVIRAAALASRAEGGDVIDGAILGAAGDITGYETLEFHPFDPVSKFTEATLKAPDGRTLRVAKGAPQVIARMCAPGPDEAAAITAAVDGFAERGFRALGVAQAEAEGAPWRFLGVLPLFDPPRASARDTIKAAEALGISVKMVTGDALAIARETARALEMGDDIRDAGTLTEGPVDPAVDPADGFAQVFPEHKFHIVEALQREGHIVAMTGDGVNDAPALKRADCGFAVSGATDAARAAADIVLTTPGLSVIVDAVRESRRIFRRMSSYATYRITETLRVLIFMALAIMVFGFYPLTAVMIVMLALLNDGAILSIAYDNAEDSARPEAWNMRRVLGIAAVLGVVGPIASFGLFFWADRIAMLPRDQIQTLMYLKLSVAGHLTIFLTRTRGWFWSSRPATILLVAVFGTQALATLIAVYGLLMPPLDWSLALLVWAYSLALFVLSDAIKVGAYKLLARVGG